MEKEKNISRTKWKKELSEKELIKALSKDNKKLSKKNDELLKMMIKEEEKQKPRDKDPYRVV